MMLHFPVLLNPGLGGMKDVAFSSIAQPVTRGHEGFAFSSIAQPGTRGHEECCIFQYCSTRD